MFKEREKANGHRLASLYKTSSMLSLWVQFVIKGDWAQNSDAKYSDRNIYLLQEES